MENVQFSHMKATEHFGQMSARIWKFPVQKKGGETFETNILKSKCFASVKDEWIGGEFRCDCFSQNAN